MKYLVMRLLYDLVAMNGEQEPNTGFIVLDDIGYITQVTEEFAVVYRWDGQGAKVWLNERKLTEMPAIKPRKPIKPLDVLFSNETEEGVLLNSIVSMLTTDIMNLTNDLNFAKASDTDNSESSLQKRGKLEEAKDILALIKREGKVEDGKVGI